MSPASPTFLLGFLPAVMLIFFLCRSFAPTLTMPVLLGASLIFYACADSASLPLILMLIAFNYGAGKLILGAEGRSRTLMLAFSVLADVMAVAAFKYGWLTLGTPSGTPAMALGPAMPLGLSFLMAQQISYLVVLSRRPSSGPGLPFARYLLYSIFFPTIFAGPIFAYSQGERPFRALGAAPVSVGDIARGLTLLIMGLVKVVALADPLSRLIDPVFAAAAGSGTVPLEAWLAAWAFLLQLYFNFSGYSDVAIGIGLMIGIRLPINFNSPLKARSGSEYFNKWHISLVEFIRLHVYAPIFSLARHHLPGRATTRSTAAWCAATLVSFTALAWWHGGQATFLLSGVVAGVLTISLQLWHTRKSRSGGVRFRLPGPVRQARLLLLLTLFGILFRAGSLTTAWHMLDAMFRPWLAVANGTGVVTHAQLAVVATTSAIALAMPNSVQIFDLADHPLAPPADSIALRGWRAHLRWGSSPPWALMAAAMLVLGLVLAGSGGASAPIYARF